MICHIQWQVGMTRTEWQELCARCPHTTLLQSYYYAQAMRAVHKQGARHGVIYIDGVEAGIVQMQNVSLLRGFIHMMSIDRGPLWFAGYGSAQHLSAFFETINCEFPHRFGRKRRFMPEYQSDNKEIKTFNWKEQGNNVDYRSYIVDLSPDLSILRSNLKQKWRNILNKAEKELLKIETDWDLQTLGPVIQGYLRDRTQKLYAGPSPHFVMTLAKYAVMTDDCLIMTACDGEYMVAAIMVFIHGRGATYQIGWTTPTGRNKGAHHLLLWQAIMVLKVRGVTVFDLGGHKEDADGIKRFKQGLGGQEIALIGRYS